MAINLASMLSGGLMGGISGLLGGLGLSVPTGVTTTAGGGRGSLMGAQVIASGHRMLLLQTPSGNRVLVRRAPRRRRYACRRSTRTDKLMELAMIKAISK